MSISLEYRSEVVVVETPNIDGLADGTRLRYDKYNTSVSLSGSTTPAVTKHASFDQALSTGAAIINLASLPGPYSGSTVDFTGLKVQAMKFKAPATNGANITISKGASNGFGFGTAGDSFTIAIPPGSEVTMRIPEGTPDVASGARTIDMAGSGSTDKLEITLVAG